MNPGHACDKLPDSVGYLCPGNAGRSFIAGVLPEPSGLPVRILKRNLAGFL